MTDNAGETVQKHTGDGANTVEGTVVDVVETMSSDGEGATAEVAEAVSVDAYSKDELAKLTVALGKVVLGAAMSEPGGNFSTMREIMAAMRASAMFVGESSNPLLRQIVTQTESEDVDKVDMESEASKDPKVVVQEGIVAARSSYESLLAKGHHDDADAWAQLLLTSANAAVEATKTGGFLGFGGEKVTESEQAYMQQLADTLGYKKESA
ncbi:MAG: hypothetical protein M9947_11635 [Thermomicrobiales bacterium]|nr:hypothetical protein [Thermomicrobiales bacterium]